MGAATPPSPGIHFTAMALPMKKAAAMKAMKAKKTTMKAMKKGMKAKKVSVIAKGKMAKAVVFSGRKQKTASGLTKANLTKSKEGKIVSKARSQNMKKAYANSALKKWIDATKAARKALNLEGFVPMGGKTAKGRALYAKAKSLLK